MNIKNWRLPFSQVAISFSLITCLLVGSCTTPPIEGDISERAIASEAVSPLSADQLFTINISGMEKSEAANNVLRDFITRSSASEQSFKLQLVPEPKMSAGDAFKIAPSVEDNKFIIKIFHTPAAVFDYAAVIELEQFLKLFTNDRFESRFNIYEVFFNAQADDFIALQATAKLRKMTIDHLLNLYSTTPAELNTAKALFAENKNYWEQTISKYEQEQRVHNKYVKARENQRKAIMDGLDKLSDDQQFRTLVAKNDRKGAAHLIRSYLPWEQMPPFEKLFWETNLDIMVNPLPLDQRVLIYRGINDDVVQVAQLGAKKLSVEEAIKEQQIFLMSTMMTKNQGTWNRRLRSLTAMYDKFMGIHATDQSNEYTKAGRVTHMFKKHSIDPKGSPFLSYTPKFSVSHQFGANRNTAYFLDPRAIYFNFASGYMNEAEFLLPLINFPEDLAAVYDKTIHTNTGGNVEHFMKGLALEKLQKKLGATQGQAAFDKIQANSTKMFDPILNTTAKRIAYPENKFINFFKKLLGLKVEKPAIIPESSHLTCTDIIKKFWK